MLHTEHKVNLALAPVADFFAGTVVSARYDMKRYQSINFFIQKGVGLTGTSTITLEKSSAADGTGAEAIEFYYRRIQTDGTHGAWTKATVAGFTTTAGSAEVYEIAVDQKMEGLAEGDKTFVGIKAVEVVDSPVVGAIFALQFDARFGRP